MANKRLSFDVEEDLHSSLLQESEKRGVSLETLCSLLLDVALKDHTVQVKEVEPKLLSFASLTLLREEVVRVQREKPDGWERTLARLNSEIAKRIRV